jgi:diguanylate cyclase (GGDEF)-like protein
MRSRSARLSPVENGGRESRIKLILLVVALLLVVGYASTLTALGDMVWRRIVAALSVPMPFAPTIGASIAAAAMLGLILQALSRRRLAAGGTQLVAAEPFAGVRGRGGFLDILQNQIDAHAKIGRQLALHIVDIDDFAAVNRTLGEAEGDAFLRLVAERLLVLVEQSDRLARIGDDEFAVIQPETGGARHAEIYAKRIEDTVKDACAQVAKHARPGVSIGVAVSPDHGDTSMKLLHSASLALKSAKAAGGGFAVYARDMDMSIEARLQMEKAIGDGLHHGWFTLRYQPLYDLRARRLRGFEALVRMNHPEMGELQPDAFLPVAERSGLIQPLGDWIFREAATTAANWPSHIVLAVNVSEAQFRSGDVAGSFLGALSALGIDPARAQIEIPESVLAGGADSLREQLRRLKAKGVTIVIDDFGVGGSSLQSLANSSCDAVKLDRTFVKRIGDDPEAENMIRGLIGAATAFDLAVMAEGVERAEQVHFLMSNGCQNVQGFLFSRPVDTAEVAAIVAKDLRNSLDSQRPPPAAHEAA